MQLKMKMGTPPVQLKLRTARITTGLLAECQQDAMNNAPVNLMDAGSTILHHHRL